jgi:thiamine pyrophosphokinase
MNKLNRITHWRPANILATNVEPTPFCLIILNQPLNRLDVFRRLWNNGKLLTSLPACFYPNAFLSLATFKFVADGGSNRLYDAFCDDTQSLERSVDKQINRKTEPLR